MFRFWNQELRGSKDVLVDSSASVTLPNSTLLPAVSAVHLATPASPAHSGQAKKRRLSAVDTAVGFALAAKRARLDLNGQLPSPTSASVDLSADEFEGTDEVSEHDSFETPAVPAALVRATEVIHHQFGLEILLKHDELRLINQELAKCQIALEQLRRCHLIPFPLNCPTPEQMLDISNGTGAALTNHAGDAVSQWAPPFGVVEGPYARHYAKWLIPDPLFDGNEFPLQGLVARSSKHAAAEGRSTRNSSDLGSSGRRLVRAQSGPKLHALSSGYSQPKDKQSPCVLKRSDGQTVKLICLDCHRWDFSSTQGFINHCRIAHRRDFKSHEEAAVHCGHPLEVEDAGGAGSEDSKPSLPAPTTSSAPIAAPAMASSAPLMSSDGTHPLATPLPITEQQAYIALQSRIDDSLRLYKAGHHPHATSIPSVARKPATASVAHSTSSFQGSADLVHLTAWLRKKHFSGNLDEHVREATTKPTDDEDEQMSLDEEWDETETGIPLQPQNAPLAVARVPIVSTSSTQNVAPSPPSTMPESSSTRRLASEVSCGSSAATSTMVQGSEKDQVTTPGYDDVMVIELSPNTMASNNAPSLVSDDGEYDDSDDGSCSEASERLSLEPESDVAEINIDEDEIATAPLRRRGSSTVQLKKTESKHVTFVAPRVPSQPKGTRKQRNADHRD